MLREKKKCTSLISLTLSYAFLWNENTTVQDLEASIIWADALESLLPPWEAMKLIRGVYVFSDRVKFLKGLTLSLEKFPAPTYFFSLRLAEIVLLMSLHRKKATPSR